MADERIRKSDVQRAIAKLRAAYESDPEKYSGLKMLLEHAPGPDYDPETATGEKPTEEPDAGGG